MLLTKILDAWNLHHGTLKGKKLITENRRFTLLLEVMAGENGMTWFIGTLENVSGGFRKHSH